MSHHRSTDIGIRHLDDTALLERARSGDRRALDALLRNHQPRIHALCRRITGNEADALDATQEAMLAVVRGLPRFDGRSRFTTWVHRVATNACLDELRRRRRRPHLGVEEDSGSVDRPDHHSRPVADRVADRLLVDQVLPTLPEHFGEILVLREVAQLEYAEIAEVLGVACGTVRSRLARARSHLADAAAPSPEREPEPDPALAG